jgi:Concanavalin A-like lectin/glucanases superfamily
MSRYSNLSNLLCVTAFVALLVSACSARQSLFGGSADSLRPALSITPGRYANAVLADAPFEYYKFNETSGTVAADSSGNGKSGTYLGTVLFDQAGPLLDEPSNGIGLAGSTAGAGMLAPATGAAPGTSYAIEAWIYPVQTKKTYSTIWGYDSLHRLLLSSGGFLLSQMSGNFFSTSSLRFNQWHDVVFDYDAKAQMESYYIDGLFDRSASLSNASAAFTAPYYAGQYDTSVNYKFYGMIAQFAFYKTALSASQIVNHYTTAGYPAPTPRPSPTATPLPTPSPSPSPDAACNGYRWPVKVATDAAAASIELNPVNQTTIAALTSMPAPIANNTSARIPPAETAVFQLTNVTLSSISKSIDLDYHLVLKDALGHTIITESADPSCAAPGRLAAQITTVRKTIDSAIPNVSRTPTPRGDTLTLQGVGFNDFAPNFASGQAPNGIELHAILAICFGVNCTLGASPTPSPSPASAYASAILADKPEEYYKLGEAGGTTAADSSGNGASGTYIGSIAFGQPGPLLDEPSTSISLNGGTASTGVQAPAPGAVSGTSYSIEVWVFPLAAGNYTAIWGYNGTHRLLLSSSGLLLTQLNGNFFSKKSLTRNAWHQVVFVYDASSQNASYYVDGLFDSSAVVPAANAAFTSTYYFGQYDTSVNYKWIGRLAQAAFYRAALGQNQVSTHYAAAGYATPSPAPSPAATPSSTPPP